MTIGYWCVLAAALLPYVFTLLAKSGGRYNNHAPREFLEKQSGLHKRAHWVQLNSFEAFPPFAAAVIIAHLTGVAQSTIDALAIAFIVIRVVYGVLYLTDKASLRSVVWMAGVGVVVALFVAGA
ncbi:MAPEG family protein [Thalassolituus sp. LLYu03]|uniref:MAPEG family protein n=1 Tax=Thalassolituus sp. LLYu03 TaxID=3421656 RepID=UPI003D2C81B0